MVRFGFLGCNIGSLTRLSVGGTLALASVVLSTGCQSKLYDDNKALREQNLELQARLAERHAMKPEMTPLTPPDPIKPAPVPAPVPAPAPTPTPTPVPVPAPAPLDLGGEVTVDPLAGTTTVNFLGDALFDSGKATLKESAKAGLDKVASALKKQYAGKTVKVQGHSDSDPIKVSKWKSNQELSQARAKAVQDYLVLKGADPKLVSSEGLGDTKPKSTNPAEKSKNRRVEIVVLTR